MAARAKVWKTQDSVSNATEPNQMPAMPQKGSKHKENCHTSALVICEQVPSHPSIHPHLFIFKIISLRLKPFTA